MNPRAITLIIVLMAMALLGLIIIQSYWINWSVRLNETKFDKEVFAALNGVKERIESQELMDYETLLKREIAGDTVTELREFYKEQISENYSRALQSEEALLQQFLNLKDLSERINPEELDQLISQELYNRGIRIKYSSGVWSTLSQSFVILNNHYAVEGISPVVVNTDINKGLYTTPYHVDLFANAISSPGRLMIHFDNKRGLVFSTVWPTIGGSVLFTIIILICFSYTIYVILRQKKLSDIKTDFINNMTHEFKTPIATISLAADSITSPMVSGNPDKVTRFAGIIKQENRRMLEQVEKVLQIAQVEKKDLQLNLGEVDLHRVIEQATENNRLQIDQREGLIQTRLAASKPIVRGDLTHITNILYNLLDNATKYSLGKPEILVETRDMPGGVEVQVHDKGIGMSREQRRFIFDKFYRVSTGNLHDVKGFGLGLSYVKAMMLAHKGSVDVKSELGKGSTFTLFFPYDEPLDIL